jgi:hypothetical protein
MYEKIVTSQVELDAIPVDYNGRIIIKFGTLYNRAVVNKRYAYSVVARGNSSVVARDNSSVVARENSSVEAWDNSSVEARGNSSVVARDNSSVEARGNVKVSGNARVVYNTGNITDWAEGNDIPIIDGKIMLYKAVHKRDTEYVSDWDKSFFYEIGEMAVANGFTADPEEDCGEGIHMATASWACAYAQSWDDIALLELEADAAEIVVPLYETGKVRAPKAKVLREVPLEEAGLLGKMIAKRLNRCKAVGPETGEIV